MAKLKVRYVCQQCGRTSVKPLGRCPQCGEWNSMVEEILRPSKASGRPVRSAGAAAEPITAVQDDGDHRWKVPIEEFSRVLGGGIVPGSVVLIGGDPGIGKSTLLLQLSLAIAREAVVLYVSGEESARQVKTRARRLSAGELPEGLYLLTETDLETIEGQIQAVRPSVVVVDSIQTCQVAGIDSPPGSISQVRESASLLQNLAKREDVAIFLIGHVTKQGSIAGPRVLEHIVDTVLYLEGDAFHAYRLLRSVKNRFGPTTEVGVFEMGGAGMEEVSNPSEAFLAERVLGAPGSAIAVTLEGTRPLLVEVQGLTSRSSFGNPRRTANGVDFNRLLLTIAVLSRRVGLRLVDQDVFVNVVGGMRIDEPAADLALAMAIASSALDKPLPVELAFIGEVGLSGELRAVAQLPIRLQEASKLGFRKVIVPRSVRSGLEKPDGIEVEPARSLKETVERVLR